MACAASSRAASAGSSSSSRCGDHRPPTARLGFEDAEKAKANVLAELERVDPQTPTLTRRGANEEV